MRNFTAPTESVLPILSKMAFKGFKVDSWHSSPTCAMAGLRFANVIVEDALGLPEGVFTLAVYTGGFTQTPDFAGSSEEFVGGFWLDSGATMRFLRHYTSQPIYLPGHAFENANVAPLIGAKTTHEFVSGTN